ncbi:RNA recognition domain-containing protein [Colletotrichum higginsianum]|uniref:RNA recognition domain-containing protein n=1 Tax=Colletotrichum higginsianum (strain IMI 349063) TaxID=759273 RepID=H1W0L5_COLHI|nr:RNA recognition domain-containing protein [Colletotrichum higginsianum]
MPAPVNDRSIDLLTSVTNLCYRQVRQGIASGTKGTAFVVYEDVMDAKQACDKLNGFNFQNRYLIVLYHQPEKMLKSKEDLEARRASLAQLKKQHGID